jgi:HAD superfamily hydrolase (TIGR01509 family)
MIDLTRFQAIVFDFDGVLVDSETLQARCWTLIARELGLDRGEIRADEIAGQLDRELVLHLFPGSDPAQCLARKSELESSLEAAGELQPVPGAVDFVRRAGATHTLAICSSSRPEPIRRRVAALGLLDSFSVIQGRVEGAMHKPAPDLYLRTLESLALVPQAACAIEDSLPGVKAAKSAGLYTIQLLHVGMPRSELADAHIRAFSEL